MVDDRPEDATLAESSRPKREPPTIDLKATDVSEAPKQEAKAAGEAEHAAAEPAPEPAPQASQTVPQPVSPWAIAPISGAVAAALVIGVGWVLGWPAVQAPTPAPKLNAAAIDDLTARIGGLESKASKPTADPAAAARIDGVEKAVTALRSELAAARAQADKLASAVNEIRAQPRDGSAPAAASVDLSPINERIAQIERAAKAQESEIAAIKSAEAKPANEKPADDATLRRVVAASLLDVAVRHGDGFAAQLSAAKPLAPSADALKPLEAFAASGVPSAPALCRELVAIVPKLAPSAPEAETTGSGIVDRLQAGAAKLVRVQRADATGTDRASVVARVTTAALRNDLNEARRELNLLAPADRAAAQAWLDRADSRDAALAASRKFASDAMAALATAK
ncbi:COG4223 family protein [Bradyrhizobium sp.]|uniref:COG4223 family protein n=1 Tax=Bradyrhizobium sp. TaxID=376 RepID=UPI00403802B8